MAKLRWGVLGAARIARRKVIPATQRASRCEVVAIASRQIGRAREIANELGVARAYGSYQALLADASVDAVYIPLPNHLHAEWTIASAQAGKHVLCEKPLAVSVAEAERMIEVCDEAGVLLSEAFMYRLHPSWVAARQMVSEGKLGRLRAVQSWFSYCNEDPNDIRNRLECGGGALLDIGCYAINLSRMLFEAEPRRVASTLVRDAISGVDVVTSAVMDFGSGLASFTCSMRSEPDQRVDIHGSKGRLTFEIPFNIPPDRDVRLFLTAGGRPPTEPHVTKLRFEAVDQYMLQAEAFAEAVLEGGPPPLPPEDSVANLRVIERVFAGADP